MVKEDVHQNAADRDVEPDGERHTCEPPVAVEAAAPRAVDGRQRQRHHQRRQHDMWDKKPEVDGAQPRRTVEGDRAHLGVVDQVGDEEEGGGGEGRDHAHPVSNDAAAADQHVACAEENRRRPVQCGVDLGKPGRPTSVPSARHIDDEGNAADDDGRERADDPGGEPLGRDCRFGRAGRERGGFRRTRRESWPDASAVSTGKTQADAARGC